jgi:glucokinase
MVSISTGESVLAAEPAACLLAFDVGGSHVTAGLCLLETMTVSRMASSPLPESITSSAFIDLLEDLGERVAVGVAPPAGASLAFPAPFDYHDGISQMRHKLKNLYGVNLGQALAQRLAWPPERVCFLNDADAALLGETGGGAAKGIARAAGIMLGTGIGFSFVQNGILDSTAPGVPPDSEIWNLPFRDGIVEDFLSSRAIERDYQARTGQHHSVAVIALRSVSDGTARDVFAAFGRCLGEVIAEALGPLNPEVIVFGGGISRSSHLFLPAARKQLKHSGIRLVSSMLFEKAPLLGAAMYWRQCAARPLPSYSI